MTREEARKAAEVMIAYADGKEIEIRKHRTERWFQKSPSFDWGFNNYRIKPEPTYRPFKDAEECWQEMQKHQPFGWVKHDGMGVMVHIDYLNGDTGALANCSLITLGNVFQKGYTFVDGTPFGIKEGGEE